MQINWRAEEVSIVDIVKIGVVAVAALGFFFTMQSSIATNTETLRQLKSITANHEDRINEIEHWKGERDAYERGLKDAAGVAP